MAKNLDIKAIIADIKAGIEQATSQAITKEKIVADVQQYLVQLCDIKKALADITNNINLDIATDNKLQINRLLRLEMATNNLQDCIDSLGMFYNDNK